MHESINPEVQDILPQYISKLTIQTSKAQFEDTKKLSAPIDYSQHCENHMILPSKFVKIDVEIDSNEDLISELRCYLHKKFKKVKFENKGNGLYSIFLQLESGLNELIIHPENSESAFKLILDAKNPITSFIANISITIIVVLLLTSTIAQVSYIPSGSMMRTFIEGDYLLINKLSYLFKTPKLNDIVVFDFPYDPERQFVKRVIALPNDKVQIKNGKVYVNGKIKIEDFTINNFKIKEVNEISLNKLNPKKHLDINTYLIATDQIITKESYITKNIHNSHPKTLNLHNRLTAKQSIPMKVIGYELDTFATIANKISKSPQLGEYFKYYIITLQNPVSDSIASNMKETLVPSNKYFVAGDNRDNSMDSRYWGFVSQDRIKGQPIMRFYPNFQIGFKPKENQ